MKKIIFFDLDRTLLNSDLEVLEENKEAIKIARDNGIVVVICSGRQQSQVRFYQKKAGAGRYIITTNGAEIYDTLEEEQLFKAPLDKEFCKKLYHYIIKNQLFFRIDTKYARYFNEEHNRILDEVLFDEEPDKFFDENDVLQFSVGSTESNKIDEVVSFLQNYQDVKVENRYITRITEDRLDVINVVNKIASKGNAIRGLCKYLKIDINDAVGFGDDLNDISMFEAVGHPIAMGNACDELKRIAEEVTLDNNKPGIAQILNRIIEENKEQN